MLQKKIFSLAQQHRELRAKYIVCCVNRDPHTPVFDSKGVLWFTVQRGNFVGRLDPASGKITLKPSPTSWSKPYGIIVNSGIPFFCEFGSNKIGRIDPATMSISEFVLPKGARPPADRRNTG